MVTIMMVFCLWGEQGTDTECFMKLTIGHISQVEFFDIKVEGGRNHTTPANRQVQPSK